MGLSDTPSRLFLTQCEIEPGGDVPGQGRIVDTAIDLADVIRIRQAWDFDRDAPSERDGVPVTLVDMAPDICAYVVCEYHTVLEAWMAWVRHADKLARLRN